MADQLPKSDLQARLVSLITAQGITSVSTENDTIAGTQSATLSKWFLGGRKVVYRFRCQIVEGAAEVRFRESAVESSWGVPPLALTVEKTSQKGTRVSDSRSDTTVDRRGAFDYGALREIVERGTRESGWQFTFEAGKTP